MLLFMGGEIEWQLFISAIGGIYAQYSIFLA
ncbi:hypothetical protein KPNJ1_00828 [Klebsiella pneumoniae 30660/NJST258_1]|uniref:Uncharacterized protein n=1 Tax=Klebsiella pneumoniae 30684/NJST258_2 TaxID=1420013 RepID=W8UPW2_KLEPN|nr:hypothetical protein KPNJ2_00863 [Klebsiella pneumoniae 30684/NJST258_2]AHM83234.1 hypothetical protein KPNJ1_00828 [Klebsiella pneumoniae 30660/NJST258_1]